MTPEQDSLLKQIAAEVGTGKGSALDAKIDSLGAQIAALTKAVAAISLGGIDIAALAKAVNDDAASRLAE